MRAARHRIHPLTLLFAVAGLGASPEIAVAEAPHSNGLVAPRAPTAPPAAQIPLAPEAPPAAGTPAAPEAPPAPGDDGALRLSLSRDFEVVAGADRSAGLRITAQGEVEVRGSGYRVWLAREGAGALDPSGEALFIDFDRDGALDPEHERVGAEGLARFGELELRVELTR
jgi:hypothetical protein